MAGETRKATVEDIRRMWGRPIREIAEALGLSKSTVMKYARLMGLAGRGGSELARVLERVVRGEISLEEAAEILGLSPTTVKWYLGAYRRIKAGGEIKGAKCPDIPREDLERLADFFSDREIAELYGTTAACVSSLRRRYGIRKGRGKRLIQMLAGRRVAASTEKAAAILEILGERGWVTSRQLRSIGFKLTSSMVSRLEAAGVRVLRISRASVGKCRVFDPRMVGEVILYMPGSEEKVAEYLAQNMVKPPPPKRCVKIMASRDLHADEALTEILMKKHGESSATHRAGGRRGVTANKAAWAPRY